MEIGSMIKFGEHNWRIMDIANDKAFLISCGIIDTGKYHKEFTNITWEHCSLRKYLNGKFLKTFGSDDRAKIIETRINNLNNPLYNTSGGKDTKDYIFLLSLDEVKRFFPTDEDRVVIHHGSAHWWWLRTPGQNSARTIIVKAQGGSNNYADGAIGIPGERIAQDGGGIRPALWIGIS